MKYLNGAVASVIVLSLGVVAARAEVPQAQVDRLGRDLTPVGAEKAGNGDDIPAWTGGLQTIPSNVDYKDGDHLKNPFPDDKVLYTVTGQNMDRYTEYLTPGQAAMLKQYDDYKLKVYKSRRTCAVPDNVYAATKRNAKVAQLVGNGNGVAKGIMGFPFPVPNNAYEIIWNHTLRYRSFKLIRQFAAMPVTSGGSYTPIIVQDQAILWWSDPSKRSAEELDNTSIYYIARTLAPARAAGNIVLVHEAINSAKKPRQAWQYSPGTRRVRRAPNIAFDNPGVNTDGLSTADSFDGFNGSLERYTWTVLGKNERFAAENNYDMGLAKYEDLIQARHLNQDLLRYEKRRLWEIQADLKSDTRHVYHRRVFHIDEDTWQIASAEMYDGRGDLWRVEELQGITAYNVPLCGYVAQMDYDLKGSRYLAQALNNEEPAINFFADELRADEYTPSAIRRMGSR